MCALYSTNCVVSGSIGIQPDEMRSNHVVFDTGTTYNVFRKDILPYGWEEMVDETSAAPRQNDENGKPLELSEVMRLRVSLRNTVYHIYFVVAERLAVE